MVISALTSPIVFACHCDLSEDGLQVGILAFNDEFEPGWHTLYNADRTEEFYQVYIPHLPNPSYNATLTYGYSIPDSK